MGTRKTTLHKWKNIIDFKTLIVCADRMAPLSKMYSYYLPLSKIYSLHLNQDAYFRLLNRNRGLRYNGGWKCVVDESSSCGAEWYNTNTSLYNLSNETVSLQDACC
jgi:hypothetical protein